MTRPDRSDFDVPPDMYIAALLREALDTLGPVSAALDHDALSRYLGKYLITREAFSPLPAEVGEAEETFRNGIPEVRDKLVADLRRERDRAFGISRTPEERRMGERIYDNIRDMLQCGYFVFPVGDPRPSKDNE